MRLPRLITCWVRHTQDRRQACRGTSPWQVRGGYYGSWPVSSASRPEGVPQDLDFAPCAIHQTSSYGPHFRRGDHRGCGPPPPRHRRPFLPSFFVWRGTGVTREAGAPGVRKNKGTPQTGCGTWEIARVVRPRGSRCEGHCVPPGPMSILLPVWCSAGSITRT